eukprot:5065729-Pyramimonas_sp.AAC.1
MNKGTQVIRRIRAGVTKEEMENLKDLLEDELEGPIGELSSSVRAEGGRTMDQPTREAIERLATQVDDILTKARTTTLEQVGEEIT